MKKHYTVSWKMTGITEVAADSHDGAEELVNNLEDPEELVKRSIGVDFETTGASQDIFDR